MGPLYEVRNVVKYLVCFPFVLLLPLAIAL